VVRGGSARIKIHLSGKLRWWPAPPQIWKVYLNRRMIDFAEILHTGKGKGKGKRVFV